MPGRRLLLTAYVCQHILQAANIPYQSCSPADSAQAQLNNCNTLFYRSTVRADGNKRGRVTDTKAQGLQ